MPRWLPAGLLAAAIWLGVASAQPIASGLGQSTADLGGLTLDVYTYRPAGCTVAGLLIVFHGLERNASDYRDFARPLADRTCLAVAAPRFDKTRFPTWRYQRGGVIDHGVLQPPEQWTGQIVLRLVAWLRQQEGAPSMPYYLIGHSAGGQFLSRVAAYTPGEAARIVVANPSTWVEPNLTADPPFGFSGLPENQAMLRQYLASPLVVLLGQTDRSSHDLDESPEARAQGDNRLDRGQNTFAAAEAAARSHGWAFNWRLLEVPQVGHNAAGMFFSSQAVDALGVGH